MRAMRPILILLLASTCWAQGLSFHYDIPIVERVVCPCCKGEGQTSTVTCWGTSGTLMYSPTWYDSLGFPHHEDPNYYKTRYECSRGHRFSTTKKAGESLTISKQCSTARSTPSRTQRVPDSDQRGRLNNARPLDSVSSGWHQVSEVSDTVLRPTWTIEQCKAARDSARLDSTIGAVVRDEILHLRGVLAPDCTDLPEGNIIYRLRFWIDTTGRK